MDPSVRADPDDGHHVPLGPTTRQPMILGRCVHGAGRGHCLTFEMRHLISDRRSGDRLMRIKQIAEASVSSRGHAR